MEGTQEYIDYLKDQYMDLKDELKRTRQELNQIEKQFSNLQGKGQAANTLMMKAADLLK